MMKNRKLDRREIADVIEISPAFVEKPGMITEICLWIEQII